MSTRRFIFIITILVIALFATGTAIWITLKTNRGAIVTGLNIGGPFSLIDHTGQRVTEADYADRVKLIFFGYSFCPDICPTELSRISTVLDDLGRDAEKVVPIFVTIDPHRDSVEALRDYQASFHPAIQMLTGNTAEIAAMAANYRVYYQRVGKDDDYLMDHSSFTFLIDTKGVMREHFTPQSTVEQMLTTLRRTFEES
jgi:protein SCO1/2